MTTETMISNAEMVELIMTEEVNTLLAWAMKEADKALCELESLETLETFNFDDLDNIEEPAKVITRADVYKSYAQWCTSAGVTGLAKNRLMDALKFGPGGYDDIGTGWTLSGNEFKIPSPA